ncbi:hypothetical protein X965_13360 [Morganella sp. EGD-HP17]|nr:hypothetical protein X965_13360 [Morganella sp. EGD-HP17]
MIKPAAKESCGFAELIFFSNNDEPETKKQAQMRLFW